MQTRPPTIRDVAERAGVAQSTVSRVLTGSETQIPISEETRRRVQEAANELGYRPHPGARSLSGKGTGLLGVIVREIGDPFFADLIDVISDAANEAGYDLVLGNAKRDPEEALALRDKMLDLRFCDGLLLCGDLRESPEDRSFLSRMEEGGHRLVSVSRGSKQLLSRCPSVTIDNRKGVWLALEHLVGLGHRRIAGMRASRVGDLWERTEAYCEYMAERFGHWLEEYLQPADNDFEGGYHAAQRLLSLPEPPTAIVALDDVMAIGAMAAVLDAGYSIPRDISVIGFDNMRVDAYLRPALTTISQPIDEIGRKAVELVLSMIDGSLKPEEWQHFQLEPKLIVRDTCAPPASRLRGA